MTCFYGSLMMAPLCLEDPFEVDVDPERFSIDQKHYLGNIPLDIGEYP